MGFSSSLSTDEFGNPSVSVALTCERCGQRGTATFYRSGGSWRRCGVKQEPGNRGFNEHEYTNAIYCAGHEEVFPGNRWLDRVI